MRQGFEEVLKDRLKACQGLKEQCFLHVTPLTQELQMHPFSNQANKKASPRQAPVDQPPFDQAPIVRLKKGLPFRPGMHVSVVIPDYLDPAFRALRAGREPRTFVGGANPQNPPRQAPATVVSRLRHQASTAAVTHATAQTPKRELSASTLKMRQALLRHVLQMDSRGQINQTK